MDDLIALHCGRIDDEVMLANVRDALKAAARAAAPRSRTEAADFINRALAYQVDCSAQGKPSSMHIGRVELRALLDLIYGGPPADDSERIK